MGKSQHERSTNSRIHGIDATLSWLGLCCRDDKRARSCEPAHQVVFDATAKRYEIHREHEKSQFTKSIIFAWRNGNKAVNLCATKNDEWL